MGARAQRHWWQRNNGWPGQGRVHLQIRGTKVPIQHIENLVHSFIKEWRIEQLGSKSVAEQQYSKLMWKHHPIHGIKKSWLLTSNKSDKWLALLQPLQLKKYLHKVALQEWTHLPTMLGKGRISLTRRIWLRSRH